VTRAPKIALCGVAAVESGRPLFVKALDGHWVAGSEATRTRALRFIAKGYGYATWIYGVEDASKAVR
jgi:hypothetical protein